MMLDHVLRAFDLLIKSGELGAADCRSLNLLAQHLDPQGETDRESMIALLFAGSKDPDGACRSFLSRLKAGAAQAADEAERSGNANAAAVFRSLTVARIKAKGGAARLKFSAQAPKELPQVTARANRDYLPEEYLPSAGSKLEKKNDQLGEKTEHASVGLFISYAMQDKFIVDRFLKLFLAHCEAENPKAAWPVQHWSMNDLVLGENFDQIIRQSLADSDFGLTLLSEAFFDSKYITKVELTYLLEHEKLLPVGLNSKIQGKDVAVKQFHEHVLAQYPGEPTKQLYDRQIFYLKDRKGDFFADCDEEGQHKFVRELYDQIQQRINMREQKKAAQMPEKRLFCCLGASRAADYCCDEFEATVGERHRIVTAGKRTFMDHAAEVLAARLKKDRADNEEEKTSYEALADLFDWLENSKTSLYALLGDYGMGKTFTCRIFAQQLAERCETNPNLPRPVYLDLRDVPTFVTVNGKTRQPTLEEMLQEVLRLAEKSADCSAEELIEAARQGRQLLIFDGLDEKLVYYTNDMRSQFLNELLRVFPQDRQAGVKIVISCRTHHFETISQMDSFLLGLNRSGVQGEDYCALHLLPFSSSQILRLLTRLLGSEDANRVFSFIDSEAYLKDLAQRPFILRQLSRTLPDLQQMKQQGLPINAAAFYQALITDSISRDDEKHILKPRHKQQLLTDLAAKFWQNSTQVQQIDQLNDWFCAWLANRPDLAAQYRNEDAQLLEKDLRNSTLLVRFREQDFGFSHSSMQEFFLSKWLLRQWQEDENFRIDQPLSNLTRQFVFDNTALLSEHELAHLNKGLAATLARPWSATSDLALEIIAELDRQGRKVPELVEVDLRQGYLSNKKIQGLHGKTLLLDQAEAHASQWLHCHFQRIEIEQGNISGSLWRDFFWQYIAGAKDFSSLRNGVTLANYPDAGAVGASPCACPVCPEDAENATGTGRHGGLPLQTNWHYFPPAAGKTAQPFRVEDWQQGHSGGVNSCCFSPDGKRILSAADDSTLKLWNWEGRCIQTFKGHTGGVNSCCFSIDGSRILSASNDQTMKLWDMQGHCLQTFQGHDRPVNSCCFSPDGSRILSASNDKTLKLWDLTGRCIQTFTEHENLLPVLSCCFIPDGSCILFDSRNNTLKLLNLEDNCTVIFRGHNQPVTSCCFSPDGNRILSASNDHTLKLWNIQGHCLQTFQGHKRTVRDCCFSPDGSRILSASDDKTLKLWDLTGRCIQTYKKHENEVLSCCFSPVDDCILSASNSQDLKIWDVTGHCIATFKGYERMVLSCCFSPDGSRILSASDDKTLKLWDITGHCIQTFNGYEGGISSCAFSPDGTRILAASWDKTLKLLDVQSCCLQILQGHKGHVINCCFSPDSSRILSASHDNTLKLWDMTGTCLQTFQGHKGHVMSCCFSSDGSRILSASWDKTLKLWDLVGNCLLTIQGHKGGVKSCAFSPSGTHILSAASDKTLKLWDLAGNCLKTMQGHEDWVNICCFSPDGSHILSAADDQTLKLWDTEGRCLQTFKGHEGGIQSCVFNPDGTCILSASWDRTLRLWNLDGTTERIFAAGRSQWYTAFFRNNQLEKIIGTEMSWKMANLAKGGKTWTLDETGCFEWVPAQY